uniref:tripartite tricarboxylate transporter TctB family protein n=1 Tax=Pararhizobium sp. IMCC3301 TaxID=3067904 RepID=UPI0027405BBB|nr:tripartite tricarboxylate transporter TctB family protein [Pararhizobium sp. IMCC3301]
MSSEQKTANGTGRAVDKELLFESLFVMAFAAFLFGVTYTFEEVPPILAQGIQPTVFPRAVIFVMFLLAVFQALKAIRLKPAEAEALKPHKRIARIVYLTGLVLIGFLMLMPLIGTFPTLILFCPGLAFLWGERRWLLMGLSFGGFLAFVYLLFVVLLNVPLP